MDTVKLANAVLFLSTLSLRRATQNAQPTKQAQSHFYPRSPCGERLVDTVKLANAVLFLSTLSLRRATAFIHSKHSKFWHFYPRSPCGERPTDMSKRLVEL